jgi:hypothetical protein
MRIWHVFALLIFSGLACTANAQPRVALVIGNGTYQNAPPLANPVNDANDIAASLRRLDFDVKVLSNASYDEMRRALVSFGQQARNSELAVIFFAGHGMEIGGINWLIPTDAQLATDVDVQGEAIGLPFLLSLVSNSRKLGLVILDACRSNPFLPTMQRTSMTRAVDRGFVRVEPDGNVLVAYSAKDGTTASDGQGRNSPFTQALLANLERPGVDVRFLFAKVREDVVAVTNHTQQPYIYGSLSSDFIYLKPPLAAGTSPGPAAAVPDAPVANVQPKPVVAPGPASSGPATSALDPPASNLDGIVACNDKLRTAIYSEAKRKGETREFGINFNDPEDGGLDPAGKRLTRFGTGVFISDEGYLSNSGASALIRDPFHTCEIVRLTVRVRGNDKDAPAETLTRFRSGTDSRRRDVR